MPKEQKIGWLREMHKLATKDLSEYSITLEENELLESLEKWLLS